ncbi:S-adenosyl-L-methionine-dependent methyltransferase [uncultured Caudovirales phage]|uniref:S-adenosyl-L-methionine-dependent methyltransferase n=2 Tax=uncultured Caudovirales phage TaxID=2100421 RepID=A0A6J5Q4Y8_9CAUD|nr:S-adenosyl-L-methionine-dependent methyltransferase [uncultured Caudovirales phage]CAB4164566.1 S-adenosyl-L-methionine-dependent methyltransferase [uncultured Caudovirales phage]CAB4172370.1 S-adenosyl-L-methionine-dependent methyltransferase [uncultured Caudovirales phage]CAB4177607.1 S-adenosyl-L-methionine-dependent methyltransferase [uncultured Caudovirales phage]CAB4187496.1 S-adenosyl-L-methionine-dependent methyltransferase [uncultured Caudovirales phage]
MNKLRVLDLFSGIGGFSLGLDRTGGFETVAFCEIEPYPSAVLKKHWPNRHLHVDHSAIARRIIGDRSHD